MDLKIKGKNALVTGASRGIGLRIARQLADEGVNLGICARGQEGVDKAIAELSGRGVKVYGAAVDIMDGASLTSWIDKAAQQLGGLDIYISNVSAGPTAGGEQGWQNCIDADIWGTVRGCEAALRHLRKSKGGAIVLITTISGVMSKALRAPGILAYGSCKAAVIAYGAQLSKEVAPEGIRVNMVAPGPIYFEGGPWDNIKKHAPQMYADALKECVIGRLGTPEEVAAAAVFLASPLSGFTTGQNLHVDGGYMQHIAF